MIRQKFLVLCFVALVVGGIPKRKFRILGGYPVDKGDIPFQVLYLVDNAVRCGGVIISPTIVMTAAHCIQPRGENISVIAGFSHVSHIFNGRAVGRSIKNTLIHEDFVDIPGDYDNDIALLFLNESLVINEYIQPAILPSKEEEYQNSTAEAFVSGWGLQKEGGKLSRYLRFTNLQLVPRDTCIALGGAIGKNVICAGSDDGSKDACGGDSGGPLFIGRKVIGLVSFGWPCGFTSKPGGYTDIPRLREWITKHAGV